MTDGGLVGEWLWDGGGWEWGLFGVFRLLTVNYSPRGGLVVDKLFNILRDRVLCGLEIVHNYVRSMLKTFLWGKVGKYGLLCLSLQRWIKGGLRCVERKVEMSEKEG